MVRGILNWNWFKITCYQISWSVFREREREKIYDGLILPNVFLETKVSSVLGDYNHPEYEDDLDGGIIQNSQWMRLPNADTDESKSKTSRIAANFLTNVSNVTSLTFFYSSIQFFILPHRLSSDITHVLSTIFFCILFYFSFVCLFLPSIYYVYITSARLY